MYNKRKLETLDTHYTLVSNVCTIIGAILTPISNAFLLIVKFILYFTAIVCSAFGLRLCIILRKKMKIALYVFFIVINIICYIASSGYFLS